jgi:hypothetical protein
VRGEKRLPFVGSPPNPATKTPPTMPGPPAPAFATPTRLAQMRPASTVAPRLIAVPAPPVRTAIALQPMIGGVNPLATLNGIDKGGSYSKFYQWITEFVRLIGTPNYRIEVSAPEDLGGDTIEVRCCLWNVLTNRPVARTGFVVHYHPNASDAKVGSTEASQRHLKPYKSAKYMSILDCLIPEAIKNAIPTFSSIKKKYK